MAIYIDSAIVEEVESARSLDWVRGITTNPVLLAKVGSETRDTLAALARLEMGPLYYQLVSTTLDRMFAEMQIAANVVGTSLVLKVPPTENGFRFVA